MKSTESEVTAVKRTLLLVCGALLTLGALAGCGDEPPPLAKHDQGLGDATSEKPRSQVNTGGVIPEHQLNALRKAGAVEAQLHDAEEKRRAQLEALGN